MPAETKPKAKANPAAQAKLPRGRQPVANPLQQADQRWQRTARYGWDKGGSNGGRK